MLKVSPTAALSFWRQTLEDAVRAGVADDAPDLTQRQQAILLIIYLDPPPHTVRALAGRLQVTKPVITRALDSMGKLGLVERYRDPADGRNVLIKRTLKGALFVEAMGERIIRHARELAP